MRRRILSKDDGLFQYLDGQTNIGDKCLFNTWSNNIIN
jgi:hypothetical protein